LLTTQTPHPSGVEAPHFFSINGDPTLIDNYRTIVVMNDMLKMSSVLIKDATSSYAEAYANLIDKHNDFHIMCNMHEELACFVMMMGDAKIYNKAIFPSSMRAVKGHLKAPTKKYDKTYGKLTCPRPFQHM
jgi:hypothetical protein